MNADKRFFRLRFRNSCGVHQEGDLLQIAQTIMPSLHRTFGYGVKIILIRENPSRSVFIRARIYDCFRSDPQTIDGCADELRRTDKEEYHEREDAVARTAAGVAEIGEESGEI